MHKTLGILGGGQLGRMSAQAAQKLGIKVVIYTPENESPAAQIAPETIVAPYDDQDALRDFAGKVDTVTYEFENIPVETIRFLQTLKPVYPDDKLLEVSQDRITEKTFLNTHGIPTAQWAEGRGVSDIQNALKSWKTDKCIIKTTRFGYDGKGQAFIRSAAEAESAFNALNADVVIIESIIDFDYEISVIIARDIDGNIETYGPCLNHHKNHILDKTIAPAPIDPALAGRARQITRTLAEAVNLVGVLALELFVTKDGQILANEIAPRTHNSGHWTIEACETSQFENHVRTACGLPVAPANQHHAAEMINLIGDDILHLENYEQDENAHIHLYGKHDIKPGRKMGHVTILKDKLV
jgi:5-(carboxyamino)imidazole ribonucleotide synthase